MDHNRQHHDAPGPWRSAADDAPPDTPLKTQPYRPTHRHQYWFVDVRYLVKLDGRWVYSLCILEGYSRVILAGMASEHQDLTALLQILYAALSEYGCPKAIVSDNGKIFTAHDYRHILTALDIQTDYIKSGQPWENLIESQFKVQLRLADFKFEQAKTLAAIQAVHVEFIETFNTTPHWAHRDRPDERRTPNAVLDWVRGPLVDPAYLHRLFERLQYIRVVNRHGFISVQRFYIYAERGLARQRVSIWIYEGQLRIEYQETVLATYTCEYDQPAGGLQAVSQPTLYHTTFASPQLELFELDDDAWLKIRERTYHRQQRRLAALAHQPYLIHLEPAA